MPPVHDSPPIDPGATQTLIDVRAVASWLDCSVRHVYRLHDAGRMPSALKVGSLVRWSRQVIAAWIADGCKPIRSATRAKS